MNDTITLFCLVAGDDPNDRTFPVEISKTDTIGKLKKLIKTEKQNDFADIDADKLTLWKVDISLDALNKFDTATTLKARGEKLSPMRKIAKVFPDSVEEEHLHIIVVRPIVEIAGESQGSDRSDASLQRTFDLV